MKTLIIFTNSFPFDDQFTEVVFLKKEIEFLSKYFRIILVPKSTQGNKIEFPDSVNLNTDFSKELEKKANKIKRILYFIKLSRISFIELLKNIKKIKRIVNESYNIYLVYNWLSQNSLSLTKKKTIAYTYWNTSITTALLYFRKKNNLHVKIISRVHGKDLYEERNNNYIPYRKFNLDEINSIFCVSKAGLRYLNERYQKNSDKFKLARLGVPSPIKKSYLMKKNENVFRIVSCSSIIPLKRVNLILESVIEFAKKHKDTKIYYTHFGDGILRNELQNIKNKTKLDNLKIKFAGHTNNYRILEYYSTHFIDVIINASTTEGGCPVSIQEAQSYGIPFIITNVGGNPELLFKDNGIIVSNDPDKFEISNAIEEILKKDINEVMEMRKCSYKNWKTNFNAEINFHKFAKTLLSL
jgi:glycosyltransferase involved in cell wall biosynthesis